MVLSESSDGRIVPEAQRKLGDREIGGVDETGEVGRQRRLGEKEGEKSKDQEVDQFHERNTRTSWTEETC